SMMGGTPLIVSGIEFDATGRRVAFWVIPDPPDASWASVRPSVRVSAMDVCHCFEPRFPGVPRGMSPLSPVAALALELGKSHDAAVAKMNVTALMSMIIRDIEGASVPVNTATDPNTLQLFPGATLRLPPGTCVEFPPTAEMPALSDVLTHMTRLICA